MQPRKRRVLDALPITVYAVDFHGRITMMNRSRARFAESNGAPQLCDDQAVLGASIWDAISDALVRTQVEHAMATLSEGRATSLSWEFPCSSRAEERIFLMQLGVLADAHAVTG